MTSPQLVLWSGTRNAHDASHGPEDYGNSSYGLQAATDNRWYFEPNDDRPAVHKSFFYESTCKNLYNDSGTDLDCFSDCATEFNIFADLPLLHNCLLFLALYYSVFQKNNPLPLVETNHGQRQLQVPDRWVDAQALLGMAQFCFSEACEYLGCNASALPNLDAGQGCDYSGCNVSALSNLSFYGLAMSGYVSNVLCPAVKSNIDPDVGGIGIYLSYWAQCCFSLTAMAVIIVYQYLIPLIQSRSTRTTTFSHWSASNRGHERLSHLVIALTDFHKSQCFFMVATNIAACVVVTKGGLNPDSLQSIYNNYTFFKIIVAAGVLPTTFILYLLSLLDMMSWYLITITCVSVSFSLATLSLTQTFSISPSDLANLVRNAGYNSRRDQCRGFNPWAWCLDFQTTPWQGNAFSANICVRFLLLCLSALLWIVASKLGFLRSRLDSSQFLGAPSITRKGQSDRWPGDSQDLPGQSDKMNDLYQRLRTRMEKIWISVSSGIPQPYHRYISIFMTTSFLSLYTVSFGLFMKDLAWFARANVWNTTWNFGQIVAVSIWVPSLAEWLHLEIRGMRRGNMYRLLPPYRIIRDTAEKDEGGRMGEAQEGCAEDERYADRGESGDARKMWRDIEWAEKTER